MTLQDRAAQWLKTVSEAWHFTHPGPWTAHRQQGGQVAGWPAVWVSFGRGGIEVDESEKAYLDNHAGGSSRGMRTADAIASAPTHLSEGQALVRELLDQIAAKDERIRALEGPENACPECDIEMEVIEPFDVCPNCKYFRTTKNALDAAQTASEGE